MTDNYDTNIPLTSDITPIESYEVSSEPISVQELVDLVTPDPWKINSEPLKHMSEDELSEKVIALARGHNFSAAVHLIESWLIVEEFNKTHAS